MTNRIQSMRPSWLNLDLGSNIRNFWIWWSGEIKQVIPRWLWQSDSVHGAWILLDLTSTKVIFRRCLDGHLVHEASLDLNFDDTAEMASLLKAQLASWMEPGDRIAVGLPEANYLFKTVTLPLATAENLQQVMGFEMDRYTPFKADQVYFHTREISRDTEHNALTAALYTVSKESLDLTLSRLRKLQVTPQAAFICDSANVPDTSFNLFPAESSSNSKSRFRDKLRQHLKGFRLLIVVLLVGLVVTSLAIPLIKKRQAVIELISTVASAESDAKQAHGLRRELEQLTAEYNFVVNKKRSTIPVVVLLNELSHLLPDDTWVQQLDLRGDELQIRGETASASKLIVLVEGSYLLRDASFLAPLTKAKSGKETYHLGTTVDVQAVSHLVSAANRKVAGR